MGTQDRAERHIQRIRRWLEQPMDARRAAGLVLIVMLDDDGRMDYGQVLIDQLVRNQIKHVTSLGIWTGPRRGEIQDAAEEALRNALAKQLRREGELWELADQAHDDALIRAALRDAAEELAPGAVEAELVGAGDEPTEADPLADQRAWGERYTQLTAELAELERQRPELVKSGYQRTDNLKLVAETMRISRQTAYQDLHRTRNQQLAEQLDQLLAANGWRRGEDYLAYPTANGVRLLLGTELSEQRDATRLNAASALTNLLRQSGYVMTLPNGQPDIDLYERLARPDGELLVTQQES